MGLFGFIGKALGTVAKAGIGFATGGPAGAAAAVLPGILGHKSAGSTLAQKLLLARQQGAPALRARNPTPSFNPQQQLGRILGPSAAILRASPVMPGGAVATSSGLVNQPSAIPKILRGAGKRRRTRAPTRTRKRSGKRRLKFGSAAYRKKYLGKKKRRAKSR